MTSDLSANIKKTVTNTRKEIANLVMQYADLGTIAISLIAYTPMKKIKMYLLEKLQLVKSLVDLDPNARKF